MRFRYAGMYVSCVVLSMVIGCGQGPNSQAPQAAQGGAIAPPADELSIVEGIPFKNLTVFPVVSASPRNEDRFITLDEGVLAQTVKVVEVGGIAVDDEEDAAPSTVSTDETAPADGELPNQLANVADPFGDNDLHGLLRGGADVNRVMVLNRSERPLYLMPGETIVGGQQDRVLAKETIIPPGDKPVEVEVYCVEHGRWADRSASQTAVLAAHLAPSSTAAPVADMVIPLAKAVGPDGFLPGAGSLNKPSRLAVQQAKDQGAVWDKVAEANAKTRVDAPTGGFTLNFADPDLLEDLQPYLEHFQHTIEGHQRIVGVIVAINGSVESVDVFESTPLFRKLWPKLLRGYALDAAMRVDEEYAAQPVALADARRFYDELVNAEVKAENVGDELTLASRENSSSVGFSLHEHGTAGPTNGAMMGGMGGGLMGGGFGGSVHSAGYSK